MWILLRRMAVGLILLVGGLILASQGVSAGAVIALAGLAEMLLVNLLSPWPWESRRR